MADRIDQLPPTMETPSDVDKNAMKDIFKTNLNERGEAVLHVAKKMSWKKLLIPLFVFIILSLPPINSMFYSMLSESETTTLIVKTGVFLVILIILQFM
jgi:hypothetical protein